MPLDTSIYSMIRQPQPISMGPMPMESAAQQFQIKHLMDQSAATERALAEDTKIRDLFARGNVKPEEVMSVSPTKGMAYQKNVLEQQKSEAELAKTRAETLAKNMGIMRDTVAQAPLGPQGAAMVKEMAFKLFGPEQAARIPDNLDAPTQQRLLLTADELLKKVKPDYQPVSLGGTTAMVQKNPDAPGFSAAPLKHTPTPGDVETARANAERERLAREAAERDKFSQPQEVTGPDGKPMLAMQRKSDGVMVDANTRQPITGIGPKVGEQAQKQLGGVAAVKDAITEYRDALSKWNATDIVQPNARARMGTIYNNMLLQAKEAYNLGVLNGPDYMILQEVITNPASLTGGLTSKKALDDQAKKLEEIMTRVGQRVTAQQSGVQPPAAAASPAKPAPPTRAQIDAELRRRGIIK